MHCMHWPSALGKGSKCLTSPQDWWKVLSNLTYQSPSPGWQNKPTAQAKQLYCSQIGCKKQQNPRILDSLYLKAQESNSRVAEGLSSYCSPGIRKAPFSGLHASQATQIRWNKIPQNLLFWEGQRQCLLSSGCCILHILWTRIAIKEEESKASHGHEWNCLLIIRTEVLVNAAYIAKRIPKKGSQHSVGIRMVPFCIVCKPMHIGLLMK